MSDSYCQIGGSASATPFEATLRNYIFHLGKSLGNLECISSQVMTKEEMQKYGYPIYNRLAVGGVEFSSHEGFGVSSWNQKCRCGKSLSLLCQNWYVDDNGCTYHAGKRFSIGAHKGLYSCCLSKSKMHGCVRHLFHTSTFKYSQNCPSSFVKTDSNHCRSDTANIFALHTEMVYTTWGMEVARVCLVDTTGGVLVDCHVKPENPVIDYAFQYSGIRPEDLEGGNAVSLEIAQRLVLEWLNKDSILIGHSLQNDINRTAHTPRESCGHVCVVLPSPSISSQDVVETSGMGRLTNRTMPFS